MAGSCDDVKLLFSCQVDKLNGITGNTDREVCVLRLLRVFHCVLQLIKTEYIHVEMMSTLIKISVENMDKVVLSLILRMSKCTRSDGLSVGDSVESVLIRKLCNGV